MFKWFTRKIADACHDGVRLFMEEIGFSDEAIREQDVEVRRRKAEQIVRESRKEIAANNAVRQEYGLEPVCGVESLPPLAEVFDNHEPPKVLTMASAAQVTTPTVRSDLAKQIEAVHEEYDGDYPEPMRCKGEDAYQESLYNLMVMVDRELSEGLGFPAIHKEVVRAGWRISQDRLRAEYSRWQWWEEAEEAKMAKEINDAKAREAKAAENKRIEEVRKGWEAEEARMALAKTTEEAIKEVAEKIAPVIVKEVVGEANAAKKAAAAAKQNETSSR